MKKCYQCKETKSLIDFSKDRSRPDGLSYKCKNCDYKQKLILKHKDLDKYKEKIKVHQKNYRSKSTTKQKYREYYLINKEKMITKCYFSKLKKLFGITEKQYLQMLQEQENLCKICNNAFENRRDTHLDHCHKTNTVRGLLCGACNKGLGHFKDNIENLQKAIKYLKS